MNNEKRKVYILVCSPFYMKKNNLNQHKNSASYKKIRINKYSIAKMRLGQYTNIYTNILLSNFQIIPAQNNYTNIIKFGQITKLKKLSVRNQLDTFTIDTWKLAKTFNKIKNPFSKKQKYKDNYFKSKKLIKQEKLKIKNSKLLGKTTHL